MFFTEVLYLETGKTLENKKNIIISHLTEKCHTVLNPECSYRQTHPLNMEVTAKGETVLQHSQTSIYVPQSRIVIPLTIFGYNSLLLSSV
jgi:hypothetical protein